MSQPRSELQKYFGGQANIFQTSLPSIGPGSLKHREDSKLYGTDKERTLFTAQDPFYRQVGEECVDAGIGLNLFLFPSQYVDVASIGERSAFLHSSNALTWSHRRSYWSHWRRNLLPPALRSSPRWSNCTSRDEGTSRARNSM